MKLRILSVGAKAPSWVSEGANEYFKRMPSSLPVELVEVPPERRRKGDSSANVRKHTAAEAVKLHTALRNGDWVVALDERGASVSSEQLSNKMRQWLDRGQDVAFLIGGADGLDSDLLSRADERLSLSSMTLPHHLVRVVLAEALYRAWSILNGHPYHRE